MTSPLSAYRFLGAYRATHSCNLVASQAAASRLFQIRNASTDTKRVIVPTRLQVQLIQNNTHTAFLVATIAAYRMTGFTAVDTTNTSTRTGTVLGAGAPAAPGSALLRGLTFAGAAAGMTGGTLAKSGDSAIGEMYQAFQTVVPTTVPMPAQAAELIRCADQHPLILGPDEGLSVENVVVFGAAGGARIAFDLEWQELTAW